MPRYTRKYQTETQKQEAAAHPAQAPIHTETIKAESLPSTVISGELVDQDAEIEGLERSLRSAALKAKKTEAERRAEFIAMSEPYRWKPGQSGNPGGRPRVEAEMRRLIQDNTLIGTQRLIDIWIRSPNEEAALVAARICLERGFGPVREIPPDETARGRPDLKALEAKDLKNMRAILRRIVGLNGNHEAA